jgi:flagellar basal-body rod protein FlgC
MDYARTFAISAAGMAAERTRVEVSALNLANANTVAGADGSAFTPQRVLTRSVPLVTSQEAFGTHMARASGDQQASVVMLPQAVVESSGTAPRSVYEPGHPLADARGFVMQPGVDTAAEMVTIMSAMRAYEANVAVANAARSLALKTLEIGGSS